jgi:hypothetical protein
MMPIKTLILTLAVASTGLADFYFGSISGQGISGGIYNPIQQTTCYYTRIPDGTSICDAGHFVPRDNTGGCPDQKGVSPDFCGMRFSTDCFSAIQLSKLIRGEGEVIRTNKSSGTDGDCGSTANHGYNTYRGKFYANVIDTDNGNKVVGRCVYEMGHDTNCASIGSYLAQSFIHCYMDEGC